MTFLKPIFSKIKSTFEENPQRFFTEHDIHSELALIANSVLTERGPALVRTNDGFIVGRVHHEYPTPFRCYMKGREFRFISEQEFKAKKGRADRGSLDFVIFNIDYIESNPLMVVAGKNYVEFLKSIKKNQFPALDLAVEVVYFPTFDEKPHFGIMKRRVESVIQDYQKLIALMEWQYADSMPFCKEAAMMLFSNTSFKEKLKDLLSSITIDKRVSLLSVLS